MMNVKVKKSGMNPLVKGVLLVLVFGLVAMPFVGISLILRRDSGLVARIMGFILVVIAVATWGYLIYYSIS